MVEPSPVGYSHRSIFMATETTPIPTRISNTALVTRTTRGEMVLLCAPRLAVDYLRMTRMLNSLRLTGHAKCSKHVYEAMMSVLAREPDHWVNTVTLDYWWSTQI